MNDAWSTKAGMEAMDAICRIARELARANDLKERELEILCKVHNITDNKEEK